MGQIASLIAVSAQRFQEIIANPASYSVATDEIDSEGFDQTFMGLSWTLARGRDWESKELANSIFEPPTFLGEDFDYEEVDWKNEGDEYMAKLEEHIYYHTPATVEAIAAFLDTVTNEAFLEAFSPDAMNKERVYPLDAWSNKSNRLFNQENIFEDFQLLKRFFTRIRSKNNYCVCQVG